jgi:putative GTP pyrophosphokinase
MTQGLEAFLERNNIGLDAWEKSQSDWDVLSAIREDHTAQSQMLSQSAALYASLIQAIPGVHSVRWRVKDPDHLLEKIVRKKVLGEEKYASLGLSNYYEIVTDLIGIRALHLFKDDCFDINNKIASIWSPVENPVAYIRNGDPENLVEKYKAHGLEVKVHPAGYRSVHHVISSQPINRKVFAEVQIRTIFEEGWSEIDHKIRYPNLSDNELVGYFLTIFNRMAGSADEMGSFVTGLAASIQGYQLQIAKTSAERDESLRSMETLLSQLTELKQQDKTSRETIQKLREQVAKMRQGSSSDKLFSTTITASDLSKLFHESSQEQERAILGFQDVVKTLEQFESAHNPSALAKLMQGYDLKKK